LITRTLLPAGNTWLFMGVNTPLPRSLPSWLFRSGIWCQLLFRPLCEQTAKLTDVYRSSSISYILRLSLCLSQSSHEADSHTIAFLQQSRCAFRGHRASKCQKGDDNDHQFH